MRHDEQAFSASLPHGSGERLRFGERLREMRRIRCWTLQDVGDRSGISVSTISKAERGIIALTYDTILKLAFAFDMSMSELIADEDEAASGEVTVERRGTAQTIENDYYVMHMLCSARASKRMVPVFARIKAHSLNEFANFISHPGEEFVYVLSGKLTFQIEGQPARLLFAGDCVYFDSRLGHVYLSTGSEDAEILVTCWHPSNSDVSDAGLSARMI